MLYDWPSLQKDPAGSWPHTMGERSSILQISSNPIGQLIQTNWEDHQTFRRDFCNINENLCIDTTTVRSGPIYTVNYRNSINRLWTYPSKIVIPMHSKHGNKIIRHTLTFFDKTNQTPSNDNAKSKMEGDAVAFIVTRLFPPKLLARRFVCYSENVRNVANFVLSSLTLIDYFSIKTPTKIIIFITS